MASSRSLTLLVTCVGRRIELLQAFRTAARRRGIGLHLVGVDQASAAAGMACVDEAVVVPPIRDPAYVGRLLEIVARTGAQAVLPTIDTDLAVLANHQGEFGRLGCVPLVASPAVIDICRDKLETHAFLLRHAIDTPATYSPEDLPPESARRYPYFLKPRNGSASLGAHKIADVVDLQYFLHRVPNPIVQEFVDGEEYTLDVYVGLTGRPGCVVPRRRLQIRGGEVVKGIVVKNPRVMEVGRRVVEALGDSVRGLVTIQCMVTRDQRIRVIDMNPRFGGGAPLGIAAGADYPGWLLEELIGETPAILFDGFEDGVWMTRFDWSLFSIPSQGAPTAGRSKFPEFPSGIAPR